MPAKEAIHGLFGIEEAVIASRGFSMYRFRVDEIPDTVLREKYGKKTPAVPQGRFVEFYSSEIVTTEGPLPTKCIPIYRVTSAEQDGSPFGYTIGWDLLALQESIDALYSTVLTNQATFGVQNILMPDGANIGVTELAGGLNLIKYNAKAGKPESLNLTNTPQEIFSFIQQLEQLMETLSGVNSVTRGHDPVSDKRHFFSCNRGFTDRFLVPHGTDGKACLVQPGRVGDNAVKVFGIALCFDQSLPASVGT